MEATKRTFSLAQQPEVFASTTRTSRAVQRALADGRVRKVAGRLYTRNLVEPLDQVVRRNWSRVATHYFPEAVIVDRSGIEAQPSADGSLFLDAGPDYAGRRPIRLPGLTLLPRRGPGPVPGDMPHLEGLHFSSRPRTLLDNLRGSRARRNGVSRTLSRPEVEDELTRTAALRGNDALNELRDEASKIAPALDAKREMAALDDLVGAILGTGNDRQLATPATRAANAGLGFDPRRIELFETLQAALLRDPVEGRGEQRDSLPALSFIEAYFSNWIEGTEFALEEAEKIVFRRAVPKQRFEDAHDVLGTFDLVNDLAKRQQLPEGPEDLLDLLRAHHAMVLERRPQADPGVFKTLVNRAGATTFVHPDLVAGTLVEGYRYYEALPAGLSRAIFIMFLIGEVHPFTDGNGRVARVLMNAELSAAGEQRIVIPIVYRDNYLQALRALSRNGNPRPLVRVLDFAQEYAAAIDWSDLRTAERMLEETNAFLTPEVAEERGLRLELPS